MNWSGNYAKVKKYDIANGEGLRTSIFLSGCTFKCKGCFNEELWDFGYGKKMDDNVLKEIFDSMNEHIDGISILGGEPLHPRNISTTYMIVKSFSKAFPNKTIWLWTGYELEDVLDENTTTTTSHILREYILNHIDVIITGRYVEELKDANLSYMGSSNQKVTKMSKLND